MAQRLVVERFSIDRMVNATVDLFRSALRRPCP
jgi:hypothetical protein